VVRDGTSQPGRNANRCSCSRADVVW
jgi:hypothetical protein